MKFEIVDLTADADISFYGYISIKTQQYIEMGPKDVGVILGKHRHHIKGIFCYGGIINPNWSGYLTVELYSTIPVSIKKGEEVAHALIFRDVG